MPDEPGEHLEGDRDDVIAVGGSVTSTHVWKADLAPGIPARRPES